MVVSTYYLKIKFLTSYGIEEVRRDQALARHCYSNALQKEAQSDPYSIDGLDVCDDFAEE